MRRREFIQKAPYIGAIATTSAFAEIDPPESKVKRAQFVVLNDLHHHSEACNPWFEKVVASIQEVSPDFCVLLGDLADQGKLTSLQAVSSIFNQLDCPIYPVPGNHDNDVHKDTRLYEKVFPERLNYVRTHQGWQYIFLNTTDGKAWKNTLISETTLDWLQIATKQLDPKLPTLVFSHFPLSPELHMAPLNTDVLWKKLKRLKIRGVFCGHYHGQDFVTCESLVATNVCCSSFKSNFDNDPRKGYWVVETTQNGNFKFSLKQL